MQRMTLTDLQPNIDNALIVGIIIAKQRPRVITKDTNAGNSSERSVWNFTLRDSPRDYINATYWGEYDNIREIDVKFEIGDVVEIYSPVVQIRKNDDYGEQFRPVVTSPFALVLQERSRIKAYEGNNYIHYVDLLRLPTKPLAVFVALVDAHRMASEEGTKGLDLLGCVSSVGQIRTIQTKDGRQLEAREVIIFDRSSPGLRFTLWDHYFIMRAESWKPRETILFLTDVKVEWSSFHHSAVAVLTNRTVITENPVGIEADQLRNYAQTAALQTIAILDNLLSSLPNPQTIQNVMSIKQIHEKVEIIMGPQQPEQQFTALVYAFVIDLQLDDDSMTIRSRCARCNMVVTNQKKCENLMCVTGPGNSDTYKTFDITVGLADHTGHLDNCRLSGKMAEATLGCLLEEFIALSDERKCNLKWKFLGELCAVRLVVSAITGRRPIATVLNITVPDPHEAANRLPSY